ncbi:MAG TPA: type II toxin-antitoxin system HipA family toxin [Bacteroidales bacterium]
MVNVANIQIWNTYVGAVLWNESTQTALFEYDKAFLNKGWDLSPIHMSLSAPRIFSFGALSGDTYQGMPGLLADSLPDAYGKALLDRWLATYNRSFANPIEQLCYLGKRGMGALEFEPAQDFLLEESTEVEVASLVDVARKVLDKKTKLDTTLNDDVKEAVLNIIRVGTSAGGARAKAVIAYNEKSGNVRSGQVDAPEGFDHWLIKLDGVTNSELGDPKHYGRIEYVYYLLAQKAGIEMTSSKLLEENGRAHFMTKRFDRINGNEKLHTQTLCGLAHFDYKMLRAYSYEQLFQVMRQLRLPYIQAEEMFRRMVFNIVARNQDDHTKNTSFMMDKKGVWSLSPAYDISWAYSPSGEWTSMHQMSVNNKWDNFTKTDLIEFSKKINIRKPNEIIEQVIGAVSYWREYASQYGIPSPQIERIGKTHVLDL